MLTILVGLCLSRTSLWEVSAAPPFSLCPFFGKPCLHYNTTQPSICCRRWTLKGDHRHFWRQRCLHIQHRLCLWSLVCSRWRRKITTEHSVTQLTNTNILWHNHGGEVSSIFAHLFIFEQWQLVTAYIVLWIFGLK